MGINPIDLQTMFTQLDKVSKTQVQLTQTAQLQNVLNQEEVSRKNNAKKAIVEETAALPDEKFGTIKDQKDSKKSNQQNGKRDKEQKTDDEELDDEKDIFSDPRLGQHIDVTG